MAMVVVSLPRGDARPQAQHRRGLIEGLNLALSSTESTSACAGGSRYRPTTSRSFFGGVHVGRSVRKARTCCRCRYRSRTSDPWRSAITHRSVAPQRPEPVSQSPKAHQLLLSPPVGTHAEPADACQGACSLLRSCR
jgi:hypothetical protein